MWSSITEDAMVLQQLVVAAPFRWTDRFEGLKPIFMSYLETLKDFKKNDLKRCVRAYLVFVVFGFWIMFGLPRGEAFTC
jgi:hypothetical protein